jgi:NAD+ kinase
MAAGGSIVHNDVPCILITPICPHSLSFRPLIIPDTTIITIKIPESARIPCSVGIDGNTKFELKKGEEMNILSSEYPANCKSLA